MKLAEMYSMSELNLVEISGWDKDEAFFVERAEMDWDEAGENIYIRLNRALRMGAVIFLRQPQGLPGRQSHPVAYSVEPVEMNENGACEYRLAAVRNRTRSFSLEHAKGIH